MPRTRERARSTAVRRRYPETAEDFQLTATEHHGAAALVKAVAMHSWGCLLVHVPNESSSAYMRIRGALEGVRPGYPDYLLESARGGWWGVRFELKRAGEEPTTEQLGWLSVLREQGYLTWWSDDWHLCYERLVWYMSVPPTMNTGSLRAHPPWAPGAIAELT